MSATASVSVEPSYQKEQYPDCTRCKNPITTGHAYELGYDRWHTHCFSCYKCEKPLSCDSDFLVLGTGALICFDCSDSCKNCGKKIDDLAIILSSSNEAYCSDCFICCKCSKKIEDLKYAKTKRGLFCLSCHKKLLAKRKYYEEKRRRLEKNLPVLPNNLNNNSDTSIPLTIPDRSPDRPASPTQSVQSNIPAIITSTSESIVAQYLDDSKGEEEEGENEEEEEREGEEEEGEEEGQAKINHIRSISIDEVLNATLQDEETSSKTQDDPLLLSPPLSKTEYMNYSPLRSSPFNGGVLRSPNRNGMILNYNEEDSGSSEDSESQARINFSNNKSLFDSLQPFKKDQTLKSLKKSTSSNQIAISGDTHSGWGVVQSSSQDIRSRRIESKGQSDSTIYTMLDKVRGPEKPQANVSAFRTPPIDRIGRHSKNPSWTNYFNEDIDEKKVIKTQDLFDRLRRDVEILEITKQELLQDISKLRQEKISVIEDLKTLKSERESSQSSKGWNSTSIDDRPQSPQKNALVTSIARPATKPKFWKFFSSSSSSSGSSPTQHGNILSISQPSPLSLNSNPLSNGKRNLEISGPMIQNPNEFKDLNLKAIQQPLLSAPTTSSDGQDLYNSTLVQRCVYENADIPKIITTCINHIESDEENLRVEGIYRKSGSQITIELVESQMASDQFEIIDFNEIDIHAITSVLKRYLRKLPNPVFCFDIYDSIIDVIRENDMISKYPIGKSSTQNMEDGVKLIRRVLERLPQEHLNLLHLLSRHVNLVNKYSEWNLMHIKNSSLVFAPGLIRDLTGEKDIIDMKERNYVVAFIFENYKRLFQ
ncbi:hypothetical protein KAFR_0D05110 [Kazachstania africana CBS 2517]|uniref:Rho-GAP domain-containing protein n=1 Tax=Kazachstania africana (strain ATCC 22294 / BCRC 22015 / CBS 2517 / CECT 1963 / NBRC 1671 / NRRL Y-8276) TaxID=1071382 RepID=H2AUV8_KAZAF|nr:hypothetical protein KAFR_0D05110 [Kazachstania africana CBS 2517]CCF58158.1 hypothetical protein KAFR_0D05110 [Kazachstania africana CBS 2517]